MSFKATLFIFDKEYPLLQLDYSLNQSVDATGRPNSRVFGGKINVTANATKDDSGIEGAMISSTQIVEGKIVVYKRDGMQKNFEIKFANTYTKYLKYRFNHQSTENLLMDITFSALIMEIRNSTYESPANPNNPFTKKVTHITIRETPQTQITKISWVNADDQEEDIEEIEVTQKVSLTAEINNPEGSSATITIEKEDGTEFESGKKQLSFTESITEDGLVEISPFEIKEQWEEFKTADIDKLIAKVVHDGVSKKSNALQIVPLPKVIVDFRPSKAYDGEYGLDYIRHKREKDDVVTYENILGTNTTNASGGNTFTAYPTDTKYKSLKDDHYTTIKFPWHTAMVMK